jgi:hypothetical protein
VDSEDVERIPKVQVATPEKRKAASFLDEVLAEKARKKKSKKKKGSVEG